MITTMEAKLELREQAKLLKLSKKDNDLLEIPK
jgi:hypothetical protein